VAATQHCGIIEGFASFGFSSLFIGIVAATNF